MPWHATNDNISCSQYHCIPFVRWANILLAFSYENGTVEYFGGAFENTDLALHQRYIDFCLWDSLDFWTNGKVIILFRLEDSGGSIVLVVVVVNCGAGVTDIGGSRCSVDLGGVPSRA